MIKQMIFTGDCNLIFDKNLESAGGICCRESPSQKTQFIRDLKLTENFNLFDIWKVRNPHKKLFTFRQKHFTGIIQDLVIFSFYKNQFKKRNSKCSTIRSFPRFLSFVNNDTFARGSRV